MRLTSLTTRDYGCFAGQCEWKFTEGLNIITRENEWGKSTLIRAICDVFYADPSSNKQTLKDRCNWSAQNQFVLAIEWEETAGLFKLEKDFEAKTSLLTYPDGTVLKDRRALDTMKDKLGICESVFMATACFAQKDLPSLSQHASQISEALREVATQGSPNVTLAEVKRILERRISELRVGDSETSGRLTNNPGLIQQSRNSVISLETKLTEARLATKAATDQLQSLSKAKDELAQAKANEPTKAKLYENVAIVRKLLSQQEQAQKEETLLIDRRERIERLNKSILEIEQQLESKSAYAHVTQNELIQLQTQQVTANEKRKLAEQCQSTKSTTPVNPKYWLWALSILCLVLGLGMLMKELLIGGLALFAGIAIGVIAYLSRRKDDEAALSYDETRTLLHEAEMLDKQVAGLLSRIGCQNLDDLRFEVENYTKLVSKRDELRAERIGALGRLTEEVLIQQQRDWQRKRIDAEADLNTPQMIAASKLTPEEIITLESEVSRLREVIERKTLEIARLDGILESETYTLSDVEDLEQQVIMAQERLNRLIRRAKVFELAIEGLIAAEVKVLNDLHEQIRPSLEHYLAAFTLGHHCVATVDENLKLSIEVEGHQPVEADTKRTELSTGTIDQAYLAARLALSDAISGNRLLPLLLDDPFVNFDPQRKQSAYEVIEALGKQGRQIILCCCQV